MARPGTASKVKARSRTDSDAEARAPSRMTRARVWDAVVEDHYRFQLAGWRDGVAYACAHGQPERWRTSGFVSKLLTADGRHMYFDQERECEDRHLAKVKVYAYD